MILYSVVVSCPCALVLSIPLSFFPGIGGASKRGVLIKGSNDLEALANTEIVVFDKTGTLTEGVFNVQKIKTIGITEEELLKIVAYAENYSTHPVAESVKRTYHQEIEEADIVIMTDEISKTSEVIHIAKKTMKIVKQNIVLAITVKIVVLLLSVFGLSTLFLLLII